MQVYKVCESFPGSELYGLADQMKRAAVSIPSNIAEGQGRQHRKEFLHFISVVNGSLAELDTQRIIAENLHLITPELSIQLDGDSTALRKMLYALAAKLKASADN